MISYKEKKFPTRHLKIHLQEDDVILDVIVSTTELEDLLIQNMDTSPEAEKIDEQIYFFLDKKNFFNSELSELDQSITILEEDVSHIEQLCCSPLEDWTLKELFDLCQVNDIVSPDEVIEDFFDSRADLIESIRDEFGDSLEKKEKQALLNHYQKLVD